MTGRATPPSPDGSDEDELRTLNRLLMQALHTKCAMPVIPVPVAQDGAGLQPTALLGIVLALWHQARVEADAYRAWISQPAPPPATDAVSRGASEAARAHLDSATTAGRAGAEPQGHDVIQHGRGEPPDGTCRRR
ncbi:hypothetical protein PYK79_08585 [Streptomyces sp. ID05-04B]|uniref:hypothetical protein n=1 Tax=Streptomyces sp. ID05-04B TaxID=3028661 RepID=UPI0029C3EEA6|nr:hypothetical protein [Streptomyces sp. ID05-04B]MDX5563317.1 hypothetical protein [Streptomyces sp. ID05-04B]